MSKIITKQTSMCPAFYNERIQKIVIWEWYYGVRCNMWAVLGGNLDTGPVNDHTIVGIFPFTRITLMILKDFF